MAKKRYYEGAKMRDREQYAGMEETKMMMSRDSNMIKEDWNAPCLLPKEVIDRDWPRAGKYNMGYVDTLFNGVQKQLEEDASDFKKVFAPKKY